MKVYTPLAPGLRNFDGVDYRSRVLQQSAGIVHRGELSYEHYRPNQYYQDDASQDSASTPSNDQMTD